MGRQTQHVNVGTRTPDFFFAAFKHHHLDAWVLKPDAVDRIMQFNVNTQVVAVQFELVARLDATVFIDVKFEFGYIAFNTQSPVLVLGWVGGKADELALDTANGLLE